MSKVIAVLRSAMGKVKSGGYYAVARGRTVGIHHSWSECRSSVDGFGGARYKKFYSLAEAQKFVKEESTKEPGAGAPTNNFSKSRTLNINPQNHNEFSFDETTTIPYYAVAHGREVGIYGSWSECHALVEGFDGARYKKFYNRVEAQKFVKEEAAKDPGTGGKSNTFKRSYNPSIANESGFSVDNTDWTYDKDKGYYMNDDGWVKVFTDGACTNNGRSGARAGIGAFFGVNSRKNISEPVSRNHQTNNSAEIQAISQAIKRVKKDGLNKIVIYTDSKFAINAIEDWMPKWKKNGWKKSCGGPVINKNDFCEFEIIKKGMTVKFIHVRGHKGIEGNEHADELARKGAI